MGDTKDVSRRKFLELTALGAGAATLGGLTIGLGEAHAAEKDRQWDRQADVVVVGYGGAGAAAAIAAHDEGASVLILEKGEAGGGSTYYSGGFFVSPRDVDGAVRYLMECARAADREHFDLDRDGLKDWATQAVQNESWVRARGATPS
ncbi:MAG: FAD-dependent oxidoreductase [Desulfobacterales bacterium]|nr:FAD-dependent oxidoreductase [Desulfobacterales bacterium]